MQIPTHRKMIRDDQLDRVYRTAAGKTRAIIEDIKAARARGQPALVGTASIDASEKLSALLAAQNVAHEVLNAKQHAREATNYLPSRRAGRGGPSPPTWQGAAPTSFWAATSTRKKPPSPPPKICPKPTKRRASKRWRRNGAKRTRPSWRRAGCGFWARKETNRAASTTNCAGGRGGKAIRGSSAFYLSFEDSLLRVFAAERVSRLMERLQIDEDEAIESKLVTRTIENAQRKVEAHNFDIRRQLLQFDDIANDQRRIVYEQREQILTAPDIDGIARDFRLDSLAALGDEYLPPETPEEDWRLGELTRVLAGDYRLSLTPQEWLAADSTMSRDALTQKIRDEAEKSFAQKTTTVAAEPFSRFMRSVI